MIATMDTAGFERAIRNGLGRAILWLREHPWQPHADAIAHACLHETSYDPQCEGGRAPYIYEIIQATQDREHFRDTIVSEMSRKQATDWDAGHLYTLARYLAQDGDALARQAIYEKFERNDVEQHFWSADEIVRLDGVDGFMFVLRWIGRWLKDHRDYLVDDCFLVESEDIVGKDAMASALSAAGSDPDVRRYLSAVAECRKTQLQHRSQSPDYHAFAYGELRGRLIAAGGDIPRGWLFGWGKRASDDALLEAASDLLKEGDERILLGYVRIFALRRFPLDPGRLVQLARSPDERMAFEARVALRHVKDGGVRSLALRLIGDGQCGGDVLRLLERNFLPGDERLIESTLAAQPDEEAFHDVAHSAVDIFRANADGDPSAAMLRVYEDCRCSIGRSGAVDVLLARRLAPSWMVDECKYDSDQHIREAVGGTPMRE